jgi:hypothetical protein
VSLPQRSLNAGSITALLPPAPGLQRRYWFPWEIAKYPAGKAREIQAAPGSPKGIIDGVPAKPPRNPAI